MPEDEQEAENEKDEAICRNLKSGACWESAAKRRGARAAGHPLPPLNTGRRNDNSANDAAAAAVVGVIVYWIVSEGLRVLFPPRNLIPVP
jgi:hypothetical protein